MSHGGIRVLHVADAEYGGGAESVFRSTIRAAAAFVGQFEVFTAVSKPGPIGYVFSFGNAWKLLRVLKRFRPDVVHVQNYYHTLSPSVLWALGRYRATKSQSVRVVYTAHDYHLACPNSGMQYFSKRERISVDTNEAPVRLLRRYDHRSLAHSGLKILQHWLAYRVLRLQRVLDVVVSPSHFMQETLRGRGMRAESVVVRNPVELALQGRQAVSRDETVRVAYVGRLTPEKGVEELIRAISIISLSRKIELHIFGAGDQDRELRQLTACLTSPTVVHFRGHLPVEELWRSAAQLDVLVVPSIWYENAPLVIIEAASVGLPVVGNSLGGIVEMVAEVENGELCDTADPNALERAIIRVTAHRQRNSVRRPHDYSFGSYVESLQRVYCSEMGKLESSPLN